MIPTSRAARKKRTASMKKILKRTVGVVCGAAVVACLLACGVNKAMQDAQARIKRSNDLKILGIAAHQYHNDNKTFPPDQAAFLKYAQEKAPEAVPFIQETGPGGQITYHYGAFRMVGKDFEPQGISGTVLAYDNAPWPGGNRLVLMADGAVVTMSEAELQAKPRPSSKK